MQSLAGWDIEPNRNPESMDQFQQLSMPMGWLQQVSATAPSTLDLTTAAGQQYVPQAEDWHQISTFGYVGFVESAWSRPSSVPWDPGALITANNRQVAVDVTTLPLPVTTAYPAPQPDVESPIALLSTHWQNEDLDQQRPYQLQPTSGYNFGSEEGSGEDGAWGGCKPGRPPIQTKDLYGADHPTNQFASLLARRGSTSDISSHTTSPSYSVAGLSFDAADPSYLSDTTTASFKRTGPRRRTNPTSPSAGDDQSDSHPDHNQCHSNHPNTRNSSQSQSQSQTTTQPTAQTTARNRNRAAASRYRAKTQAASARLESAARTAAARHRVLRARESRLRDEVVRLKHELLARHAQCDCEMIRGYLEGAVRGVLKHDC
jgi:hypothetical protein